MPLSSYGILPHVSASRPSQGTHIRYKIHLPLQWNLPIPCLQKRKGSLVSCRSQTWQLDLMEQSSQHPWTGIGTFCSLCNSSLSVLSPCNSQKSYVKTTPIPMTAWHSQAAE